ncbi:hypothetical protein EPUS_01285 [Endocarpon pusillum Z07020]|uniref:Uncharacterized protein n=1 Tax=Endocarpon pusillum (strain Z07020 / HMAS-L-300199) TaxID=1263415 RepID=U1I1V2_ENDPU|nr:uncharacterized protein EPUS_01285 [Endocarpon pusillum Z07020]ERF75919.1 hypothetical protein EPUS_01285 [Endocarpon pusillum Z07020]
MGHKRKASDSLSPHQSHPITNHTPPAGWNSPASYFSNNLNSSRTRKRLRDGRPDEETIHQNTLSKLYAAQQQRNEQSDAHQDHSIPFTPSPTPSRTLPRTESTTSATNTIPHHREKAQASLYAFFGGGHNQSVPQIPGPDPQSSHATTLPSVATATPQCEDCSAPLFPLSAYPNDVTTVAGDTEMMDIDATAVGYGISSSSDEGIAYSCVNCGKRVCDTCAVRGDWRVCLECANPGNGSRFSQGYGSGYGYSSGSGGSCGAEAGNMSAQGAGASRMGDKRWVGGIGWL